ncbi:hypothetical protein [Thiomonas sp. FB-Cd]|uniref:hypothetical protein n=1 Tax=Thiomonas sp. FB-Cd TaxID=1158292 RepID=UPI0004DFBBAB|nr:hypothetical protein [Thiomonas sp. FB-Cd]
MKEIALSLQHTTRITEARLGKLYLHLHRKGRTDFIHSTDWEIANAEEFAATCRKIADLLRFSVAVRKHIDTHTAVLRPPAQLVEELNMLISERFDQQFAENGYVAIKEYWAGHFRFGRIVLIVEESLQLPLAEFSRSTFRELTRSERQFERVRIGSPRHRALAAICDALQQVLM